MRLPPAVSTIPGVIAASAALAAILAGLATLAGWAFDVPRLTDWFGAGVTMKANPSIALTFAGCSLLIIVAKQQRTLLSTSLALLAAALGGATLFEHITQIDLGIDTLLFDEAPGAVATAAPGRMGPPAATSLLMMGVALILLTNPRRERTAATLALLVLAIATLSLVGYLYRAQVMYTVPRLTGISLQMALLLAVTAAGIVAAARNGPIAILLGDDDARALALRLLPAALLIPLATGWLRVRGQEAGYYDTPFGTALRTVVEMALLCALTWWSVKAIRSRDRKRELAEAERDRTERRFRSVLDASAVPFTILAPVRDPLGKIFDFEWTYLNAAAARALQHEPAGLIGRRVADVLPGSWDEPGLFGRYVAAVETNRVEEFEFQSTANGIEGWFHVVASPVEQHLAVWFADITDRKRQELELRTVDRRKDEFLATLAHELRNPLAPIRQASLLTRRSGLGDAQRQWCNEVIERQVQHMSLLLDDLLDVSRITRGTLQLRRQITSLESIVQTAIETARPLIDGKKHTLRTELPPREVHVDVDPLRMAQIISNLLNNAAKYTDAGGHIDLRVQAIDDVLRLEVADNGIGVAPEHAAEIFRMFAQVKSARERSESGLGIGLALTRGLVELHGGAIEVESEGLNRGSTFRVELPKVVVQEERERDSASLHLEPPRPRRILIADDNADAAQSLARLLSLEGHEVRIAYDGDGALSAFRDFSPEVALLDIGMPGANGFEVARAIRKAGEAVLLIAITGWGQKTDRDQSAAAGFDHHLTKPVAYGDLVRLLALGSQAPA